MSNSALASLTAQYTDSENDEDPRDEESADSQNSQESQVIIPTRGTPDVSPGKDATDKMNRKRKRSRKSVRRLVSYQDDTFVSDDEKDNVSTGSSDKTETESESENDEVKNSNHISNNVNGINNGDVIMEVDDATIQDEDKNVNSPKNIEVSNKHAHYGFTLPPEPKGKPAAELVEKIRNLYEKMETNNMNMNRVIQERKEFRNPSIYEKLIQFCDINEFGTNYPPEIYDPLQWGPESYYEELARVQKNEMAKRQKDRKESDKIEQATALARKVEEEAKKRKSKWDQPSSVKPAVPPALTTTVTGTKGTVISAFGSLPKKPIM